MSRAETYWQDLGGLPAQSLAEARIQLLHAAVVLGAAADALSQGATDDQHHRLSYWPDAGALVTRTIGAPEPLRLGLSTCGLELVALEPDGGLLSNHCLPGTTLAAAVEWVEATLREAGAKDLSVSLPRPLGIPAHPLASIGTFSEGALEEAREIGRYLADSQLLLEELVEKGTARGPISVDPRDLAMRALILLGEDEDPSRGIDVGFCPGDEACDEPFWFLRPRTAPDLQQPPVMAEPGHWRTEGWQGAVMSASELFERTGSQASVANGFLLRALTLCRGLLS